MSQRLNVVALISGGKDSLYSLLHCRQHGHNVVALANLHPPTNRTDAEEEDMNSYMYQTIGHQIIPHYASALDLPLFRREIAGSAVQTGRYYDPSHGSEQDMHDETEDLYQLLQQVLHTHPEINAVSSGAILSTYQRTRVESVAVRLDLVPLAYLWQYPALPPTERTDSVTGLLEDMAAAECDARIIKIATGGVHESMLWTNVAEPKTRSRLVAGMAPFFPDQPFWLRGAVLGEGGEYETLVLDGPYPIWKKRLHVDPHDIKIMSGEGGVHHVGLPKVSVVAKEQNRASRLLVRCPQLLDVQFENVRAQLRDVVSGVDDMQVSDRQTQRYPVPKATIKVSSVHITLVNFVAQDTAADAVSQMKEIVTAVNQSLSKLCPPITSSATVFGFLQMASMSDFPTVNPIYASLFPKGEPNPPARVTIASDLPTGVKVSLSLLLHRGHRSHRRGLHVQSRSYWAPANIGPYSQAICEPIDSPSDDSSIHDSVSVEVAHVAGQISLVPHSMELLDTSIQEQTVLSLQHLWRVGQEREVDLWPWGVAFVTSTSDVHSHMKAASQAWSHAHRYHVSTIGDDGSDDEAQEDVWFQQQRHHNFQMSTTTAISSRSEHLHKLPKYFAAAGSGSLQPTVPPLIVVEVLSLPRGAPVEWWSLGLSRLAASSWNVKWSTKAWPWGSSTGVLISNTTNPGSSRATEHVFLSMLVNHLSDSPKSLSLTSIINDQFKKDASWTVAHGTSFHSLHASVETCTDFLAEEIQTATVPCRGLWGFTNTEASGLEFQTLRMALILRVDKTESTA